MNDQADVGVAVPWFVFVCDIIDAKRSLLQFAVAETSFGNQTVLSEYTGVCFPGFSVQFLFYLFAVCAVNAAGNITHVINSSFFLTLLA